MPGKTHDDGDRIACPHGCGYAFTDLFDFDWARCKDGVMITECPRCHEPIDLKRTVTTTYEATAQRPRGPHCRHCWRRIGTSHDPVCAVVHDLVSHGRLTKGAPLVVTADWCDDAPAITSA